MKRAFTLIELLVVIAIIAILAAILFPVFAQAKESAKQTQCIMQMKQLGLALTLYTDDSEGVWPGVANGTFVDNSFARQNPWLGYDNKNTGNVGGWFGNQLRPARYPVRPGMIDPYLKNHAVKHCPKAPDGAQMVVAASLWSSNSQSSYFNVNPKARGNEFSPMAKSCSTQLGFRVCQGANESEIEEPSNTMVVWEHGNPVPGCNIMQEQVWFDAPPNDDGLKKHFNFLHREGAVTIWTDSHVRRLTYFQQKRPMFSVRKDIYQ